MSGGYVYSGTGREADVTAVRRMADTPLVAQPPLIREAVIDVLERIASAQVNGIVESHVLEQRRTTCRRCGALHRIEIPCDVCPILVAASLSYPAR